MRNVIGTAFLAVGAIFMLAGATAPGPSISTIDLMTSADWLVAVHEVILPMFAGTTAVLVAAITIR
jgi:hypothetical protein